MIFVTVGNATQGFRRLLDAVDDMAGRGVLGTGDVFIQHGYNSDFRAAHCRQEAFLQMERFVELIEEAELVISHAGAGTLFHVLHSGKIPVVMPRRKKYGEHVDDHQEELLQVLEADGKAFPAWEPEDLPAAIEEARRRGVRPPAGGDSPMVSLVARAIDELMNSAAGGR